MIRVLMICLLTISLQAGILEELDKLFMTVNEGKIVNSVIDIRKSRGKRQKEYVVFRKGSEKSVVLFKHANERGTVVLNDRDNLYIKAVNARNSIRITPIQRLLGDASIGDILGIEFVKEYEIVEQVANKLTIKAKNKSNSYQKIVMTLKDNIPEKAELYLSSGKMIKEAYYMLDGNGLINRVKFVTPQGETTVVIKSITPMELESKLFRKSFMGKAYSYASNF